MGPYKGDYTTSDTVRFMFDSFSSDDPSASVTITGFAAADIKVYKNGSITERSSTAGFTATTDFDAITGVHLVALDLSDNTDAGFYADGSEYEVVISSVTIDGATINFHLGSFSIGRIPRTDMTKINSVAAGAIRLALSAQQIVPGTVSNAVSAPTTTQFAAADITEATTGHFNGRRILFTSGALAGQATAITGYTLTAEEGVFTVVALTEAPANTDTFIII